MLLILASPGDVEAHALAAAWTRSEAAVVTWSDLSCPGWQYSSLSGDALACSVGGRVVPAADIDAILTRAATVEPADLVDIAARDREYVAAEMHAFLVAWLTALGARVVNRPTPRSLLGPYWPPEVWIHLASKLGIPVQPTHRRVDPLAAGAAHTDAATSDSPAEQLALAAGAAHTDAATSDSPAEPRVVGAAAARTDDVASDPHAERRAVGARAVRTGVAADDDGGGRLAVGGSGVALTVVGERVFGDGDAGLKGRAVVLARAAGVELLSVLFDGREASARLVGADPRPVLNDEEVVDAVRRYLCTRR